MDKFQAIFEVLFITAASDGSIADSEVKVIEDYIRQNSRNINFNIKEVVNTLDMLTGQGMVDELVLAAKVINNSASAHDKYLILDFAFRLIAADGILDQNEKNIFATLATMWNIDLKRFLDERLK